jgi:hypothetical protein
MQLGVRGIRMRKTGVVMSLTSRLAGVGEYHATAAGSRV